MGLFINGDLVNYLTEVLVEEHGRLSHSISKVDATVLARLLELELVDLFVSFCRHRNIKGRSYFSNLTPHGVFDKLRSEFNY